MRERSLWRSAQRAIRIADITSSRKKGKDRSDEIIKICRRVLTTTTFMFCGSLAVEWLIQRFLDKDFSLGLVHWLSFAFAVAIFDEFIVKLKKNQHFLSTPLHSSHSSRRLRRYRMRTSERVFHLSSGEPDSMIPVNRFVNIFRKSLLRIQNSTTSVAR